MKNFHCYVCGYDGKPKKKAKGSILIMLILFCLGIIPGIIYMLAASGYIYFCPNCHTKIGV